jgi:hypothetical protein
MGAWKSLNLPSAVVVMGFVSEIPEHANLGLVDLNVKAVFFDRMAG